jgi:hypothetical protein
MEIDVNSTLSEIGAVGRIPTIQIDDSVFIRTPSNCGTPTCGIKTRKQMAADLKELDYDS